MSGVWSSCSLAVDVWYQFFIVCTRRILRSGLMFFLLCSRSFVFTNIIYIYIYRFNVDYSKPSHDLWILVLCAAETLPPRLPRPSWELLDKSLVRNSYGKLLLMLSVLGQKQWVSLQLIGNSHEPSLSIHPKSSLYLISTSSVHPSLIWSLVQSIATWRLWRYKDTKALVLSWFCSRGSCFQVTWLCHSKLGSLCFVRAWQFWCSVFSRHAHITTLLDTWVTKPDWSYSKQLRNWKTGWLQYLSAQLQ